MVVFPADPKPASPGALRVLSLNLAHGRKDALNQMLLNDEDIKRNLNEVALMLNKTGADVVALQEADGPSRWSGGFDHVALLAGQAGYPWYSRATHAKSWLFDYGTALMSNIPFSEHINHAFQPTPPSLTKGLTLGQIAWRPYGRKDPVHIDIVSVHLDFSRDSVRAKQVAEVAGLLSKRGHPLIVVGDFNSDWLSKASVVVELARRCGMRAYQPMAEDLATYRSSGRRLDWMLISEELEFLSHEVLPEVVSDHQAVVADIGLKAAYGSRPLAPQSSASRCTP